MKILYDHQIFTAQQYGGISRYFFELIKRFEGVEKSCEVATLFSDNAYYNKEVNPKVKPFFLDKNFRGKGRIVKQVNEKISNYKITKGDFDVFHPTYYDDYFLKRIKGKPFVVTFYDMIHEKFSSQFDILKSDTTIFDNKRRLLEHSSKIIAISETTKNDIVELFDVDKSKIDVVYLGNSLENFNIGNRRFVEDDYILFVGNRGTYKNFDFFVSAVADLLIKNDLKLICAGGGDFSIQEQTLLKSLNLENYVVFKKIINDDVLSNYYTHALFFVFPSLYEGFGIPVLEAFACGCPALLSNGGSLPEVGGDAAVYFDPTDIESLKRTTNELINNQSLRHKLKEKGSVRLNEFSWDKTFQETFEVYKTVI
ncbi:glycosyltransferase family 4 protein [Flavobacterium gawalongense]|uniref:Glycosyltransferase family 4 protein n=1 Tax=Flavobacterium gawalongense TaxID=2594432 RepID=A0A553BYI4_9FLAO|nr:glycosyltransferase family 1 protein [Flavobacterium gawalongense]TRX13391.1 glycosyltransferase family 4 protein [Flavobacterium gawalongense]TRX15679.1 glycosyltransferase family 4 protein [Flavobacterium gawalongense]TRX31517.1 glycosyltransferase family 4 protein [Flavobacterium gawalongense]